MSDHAAPVPHPGGTGSVIAAGDGGSGPAGDGGAAGDGGPGRGGRAERVATAARRWQRELADLGGPNTLLWHEDSPEGNLELTTAHPGGVSMLMAGRATRLSDLVRERSAFEDARRRVGLIRDKAAELFSQRGLRTCFVAIGMASWNVPAAGRRAQAPVLIRSCTLHPVNPAHTDFDIDLGDDLEINPVLVHYLATRGIEANPYRLADLAYTSARFDPQPVFRELNRLCASLPDLKIVDRKVVSTFSPAKLPMIADLADLGADLAGNDVIAALAGDPGAAAFLAGDDVPGPEPDLMAVRELLVADADASQSACIDAVRAGQNLVVAGAPGTGRTQTIANMVAALAGTGKRVLVVSGKRTALTDLHRRLAECELGGIVLDFPDGAHSPEVPSRAYAATAELDAPGAEPDTDDISRQLDEHRARLAAHRDYLHAVREPWGVSVFDALAAETRLSQRAVPPSSAVRLDARTLRQLDRDTCAAAGQTLREAAAAGAWADADDDPWAGARVPDEDAVNRVGALVRELAGLRFAGDRARLDDILGSVGIPAAGTPARWRESLDLLAQVRRTLERFTPRVFEADLDTLVGATADREYREAEGITLGWWARSSYQRKARELLREGAGEGDLHAHLAAAAEQLRRWRSLGADGLPAVPDRIEEAESIWSGLSGDLARLDAVLARTAGGAGLLTASFADLIARFEQLDRHRDRLAVLPAVLPLLDQLEGLGLRPLIDDLAARGVGPDDAAEELEHVWWSSLLEMVGAEPGGGSRSLPGCLEEYVQLDRQHVRLGGRRVAARVAAQARRARVVYADQADYLLAQDQMPGHQTPTRELIGYTADALFAARPCWTMSPLVVASVIPPGQWFDVVIFDEASQVSEAEAVSALARAGQVVVFGDEHGLPPSGFALTAAPADADDVIVTESPASVFTALAEVLPVHRLRWQYACEDERVFSFAGVHVYDGRVLTFPSTSTERPIELVGVHAPVQRVPAGAGAAGTGLLEEEVRTVAERAIEHARTSPGTSLGIVTVTPRHARAIAAELRARLTDEADPVVLSFFENQDQAEPFIVTHLEHIAGERRDHIVFSLGSVAGSNGRALHRAGPLGLDGGERRLNCAVTAARLRLDVVTSLTSADLDGGRMTSLGAQALHDLIAYAESGGDREVLRRQAEASRKSSNVTPLRAPRRAEDDVILADFALHLRKEGLVVHERFGNSSQPIDLVIEDPYAPGRVVVAIESDGRRYAECESTRERERLRTEQLRRMGWEYVRVWSQEVAARPAADVGRVIEAIRAADARGGASGARRGAASRGRAGRSVPSGDLW